MSEENEVPPELVKRCGSCARFVRVVEAIDANGEVHRTGECLLGVWPSPIRETNTCSQYVLRGTFAKTVQANRRPERRPRAERSSRTSGAVAPSETSEPFELEIPEELLDMDADEFRRVLRYVIRDELGLSEVKLGGRWSGGEMILKPGKEGTAEKRIPIESLFHKIVMVRDKLRVLEQKLNAHPQLSDEEKVQMQQYVTQCYGSLTTFNVLFAEREDGFSGQKGAKDD
ncbi:hypothetical protein LVJ94_13170 [Pendulispora rubella]|uniref:Uncharacterized protein n=1 Tax=Pendulispora rubella TaxID=2741070 RepID=A0ABZ2LB78_9BACT